MDAPDWDSREPRATTKPEGTSNCPTKPTGDPSASTKTCKSIEATTSSSHGDPLASAKAVEAPAAKLSREPSIASGGPTASSLGCRAQAEAGAAGVWDEGGSSAEAGSALAPHGALAGHGSCRERSKE